MMQPSATIRILVIDDDLDEGDVLTDLLAAQGHTVTVVHSGVQGLRVAQAQRPDLILLDVMMPEMDGFTVCAQLRAHHLTAEVPIIMITALDDNGSRLRGLDVGADEFLSKPVDTAELRLRVHTIARVNRYRQLLDERERTLVSLRQAHEAALEASRLKSMFLSTVSHELRTPLVGIIGMSDLLLSTPLDEEQLEFTQTVLSSGRAMLAMITDILEYTSLEAGIEKLRLVPFDVADTITTATEALRPQAEAKELQLTLTVNPKAHVRVQGDPIRLQLVLYKLLENAIKFTSHGYIQVNTDIISEESEYVSVHVRVSDSGIGIAESARTYLFEPFRQGDSSFTRKHGGLGLGLALSKRIVDQMDGLIGVDPMESAGTTCWFQVRLRREASETPI